MQPPSERPNSAACSEPTASITARTSSIRCSSVGRRSSGTGRTGRCRACRRGSAARTTRAAARKRANGGSSQTYSMFETQPGTKTRSTRPVADDLVGDVDVAASGVERLRGVHRLESRTRAVSEPQPRTEWQSSSAVISYALTDSPRGTQRSGRRGAGTRGSAQAHPVGRGCRTGTPRARRAARRAAHSASATRSGATPQRSSCSTRRRTSSWRGLRAGSRRPSSAGRASP